MHFIKLFLTSKTEIAYFVRLLNDVGINMDFAECMHRYEAAVMCEKDVTTRGLVMHEFV
jgi:hypothetical protein